MQSENEVEYEVLSFLHEQGWRRTRNHVGLFLTQGGRKVKIGTEGFPDHTLTRKRVQDTEPTGLASFFHWEAKAEGEKPEQKQYEVMASLNAIGELAFWSDSLESFKAEYSKYYQIR